jgi:hypothetical protein
MKISSALKPETAGSTTTRSWQSLLVVLLSFVLAALLTLSGISRAVTALRLKPGLSPLLFGAVLQQRIHDLAGRVKSAQEYRVAYLGDSTVSMYPPGHKLPDRLETALRESLPSRGIAVVDNLASEGTTPLSYYFVAEALAAAEPDLVVWQASFSHFDPRRLTRELDRGLVGQLGGSRTIDAVQLPFARVGLNADELILSQLVSGPVLGGARAWLRGLQSSVHRLPNAAERALAPLAGPAPIQAYRRAAQNQNRRTRYVHGTQHPRNGAGAERDRFGVGLAGVEVNHLGLLALGSTVELLTRSGIPVLVYLDPMNVDHWKRLDIYDADGITQSVQHYRKVVEEAGGRFLDLHARFPDSHFKDEAGHYRDDSEIDAAGELIEALTLDLSSWSVTEERRRALQ